MSLSSFPSLRRAAAAVALAATAAGLTASTAPARSYHQLAVAYPGMTTNHDNFTLQLNDGGGGYTATYWRQPTYAAYGELNIGGGRGTYGIGTSTGVHYDAPANTTLQHVAWQNHAVGLSGDWNTTAHDATNRFYAQIPTVFGAFANEADTSGTWFEIGTNCAGPHPCYAASNAYVQFSAFDITLSDTAVPAGGSASGGLVTDASLKGVEAITYHASDQGSGLAKTAIYDNNVLVSRTAVDTNGGRCVDAASTHVFTSAIPCLLSATAEASLDTTALADGNHTIKVVVEDGAGNAATVYGPATKLVANHPPVNTKAPAIVADVELAKFAAPHPGLALTFPDGGTWTGPSLTMSYAWLRCDRSGAACVQIPGATTLAYTPSADDVGHTLKLASTATNVADSVTAYSARSGEVTAPKSNEPIIDKTPTPGADGADGANGAAGQNGSAGANGTGVPGIVVPGLTTTSSSSTTHTFLGRVAGEAAGVACPAERATLTFEHVRGGRLALRYGKTSTAQLLLTCTTSGKPIGGAKLDIATKVGAHAAVASDVTTDGAGHAIIRIGRGASRGVTVGYRMFADDPIARATATLKVVVDGRVVVKANRKRLHNGQAVTLRGALAGGEVPKRGVTLAVQWRDGKRWRPFAQIRTNRLGRFAYAYKFTRTRRTVKYRLRVQVAKGQLDYPYVPTSSKSVRVTVAP